MNKNIDIDTALLGCLVDQKSVDRGKNEISGQFMCPSDFPAFDGHFPGNPILPAFVQMAMVRVLVQLAVGKNLFPHTTGRVKFGGMVRPNETVQAQVTLHDEENGYAVKFALVRGDEPVASGDLVFKER